MRESVTCTPARPAGDADDVAAEARAVLVALAGHLLGRGQHALDRADLDDDDAAGVGPGVALDDAGDDLALLGGELAERALVLGVAQALDDDLARGRRGDPPEALGGVVVLAEHLAVLAGLRARARATSPLLRSTSTRAFGCSPPFCL